MALNNFDDDQFDQESFGGEYEPEPQKPRGNRTFLIAIAIVGIIFVIALILLLLVAPKLLANQRLAQQEQAAQINAANTATAMYATSMAQLAQATSTPARAAAAAGGGAVPTKTPVVVIQQNTQESVGGSGLSASELATVAALQTQMAGRGVVGTPGPTSTALPDTGFADEVGLPMMAGLAIILVAVIVLSRRLRLNSR
jgi:LPXTG-motif cell wall-anchored protein